MLSQKHNKKSLKFLREKQLQTILRNIPIGRQESTVVEIGVGQGNLSLTIRKLYPCLNIIAIDKKIKYFSERLRKEKVSSIRLLEEDICHTSLPSRDANWVFYYNLIKHLDSGEIIPALKETRRILKEDGSLVIIEMTSQVRNRAQKNLLKIYGIEAAIDRLHGYTPEIIRPFSEIKRFLSKTKFKVVKTKVYHGHSFCIPASQWAKMKRTLEDSCQKLNKIKRAKFLNLLNDVGKEINIYGLEILPLQLIWAKRSTCAGGLTARKEGGTARLRLGFHPTSDYRHPREDGEPVFPPSGFPAAPWNDKKYC